MRSYNDGCPAAHALDLVGERWSLLLIRELLLGPKRFTDLREGLTGASANVLTDRLRTLLEAGVVVKRKLPPPAASQVYELTEWGRELEILIVQLLRWGAKSPALPLETHIGVDAVILTLRSLFIPASAQGVDVAVQLTLGERPFAAEVIEAQLFLGPGKVDHPHVTMSTDAETLKRLAIGKRSLDVAIHAGRAEVLGDQALAERFLGMFRLPESAGAKRADGLD